MIASNSLCRFVCHISVNVMVFSALSPVAFTPINRKKRTSYIQRLRTHTLDDRDRRKKSLLLFILNVLSDENEPKSSFKLKLSRKKIIHNRRRHRKGSKECILRYRVKAGIVTKSLLWKLRKLWPLSFHMGIMASTSFQGMSEHSKSMLTHTHTLFRCHTVWC